MILRIEDLYRWRKLSDCAGRTDWRQAADREGRIIMVDCAEESRIRQEGDARICLSSTRTRRRHLDL